MRLLFLLILFLSLFTGCYHLRQGSGLATYAKGLLHEKADKKEEAIEAYRKTIWKEGESSYLYVKMGNLYVKDKKTKEAKRCFFRALRIDPDNFDALFSLGITYLLENNHQLAASYMKKGLSLEPENQSARMVLCDMLVALNQLEEASEQYKILLEAFPNNYLLWFNHGNLFERMEQYDKAEEAYLSSIKLSQSFWKGIVALALLYSKQGKEAEANEYFRRAVSLNPKDSVSYSFLISSSYRAKEKEKTKSLLNEALGNGIRNAEFYNLLGTIYSEEEDYPRAEEFFRKSTQLQDTSTARFYLGMVYDKMNLPEKMEEEMKKAIEIEPENALALNYLGYSYLVKDRNLQEAYELIKRACSIEPENGAFLDSLGWAYFKQGNYRKAKKYLEKAAGIEQDAEIYEHLGYLYLELSEYTKSITWFMKAYEIGKNAKLIDKIEEVRQRIKNEIN